VKKKYRIHKDDKVMILVGKDKGKIGRVLRIYSKKDKVLIEKVNMIKRHTKGNPYRQQAAGIIEKEAPIAISNVQLVCNACTKSTRVGYRFTEDGKKVRFCKKCNEII
jgi:large subunit ribosomal protein L24